MNIVPSSAAELMDDPARTDEELRGSFRDLERMNRFLGAHAIVRAYLNRVLPVWRSRPAPARSVLSVLDVATGGGDVPAAVAAWAARAGIAVRIAALDRHPTTARLASAATASCRAVTVSRADARTLPFREASVDVCLCNLIQASKCLRQNGGSAFADERNAEPVQHTRERLLLRCFNILCDPLG